MPDARPFLIPVHTTIAGVTHMGAYQVENGVLTVRYEGESMDVELGEALAGTRAETLLMALVKRVKAGAGGR